MSYIADFFLEFSFDKFSIFIFRSHSDRSIARGRPTTHVPAKQKQTCIHPPITENLCIPNITRNCDIQEQ